MSVKFDYPDAKIFTHCIKFTILTLNTQCFFTQISDPVWLTTPHHVSEMMCFMQIILDTVLVAAAKTCS